MTDDRPEEGLWNEGMRRAFADEKRGERGSVLAKLADLGEDVEPLLLRGAGVDGETPIVRPGSGGELPTGERGRYQIVGEIARGGIGVVLQARDSDLGRDVAMKVLSDASADRGALLSRFVEEAQIGGQLQHPGIVPVYEMGLLEKDRPFFTMKLVRGQTLSELLYDRNQVLGDRRKYLRIFEQVCQTIAYAHARGVVHRDLKPANVMVGAFGEVQVIDWGLAKVLPRGGVADEIRAQRKEEREISTVRSGPGGSESVLGSAIGTPAYMSPEQALGNREAIDERTDVFCLGAILTEILTGKPLYRQERTVDILMAAGRADLAGSLESLDECDADDELVSLARDCIRPSKTERPRDAGVVAERISRYLSTLEERARAAEIAAAEERANASHERRAKRMAIALSVAVFLVLFLGGGGAFFRWSKLRRVERETVRDVAAILGEATALAGRSEWDLAVEEALRAKTRLDAGRADEETAARVTTTLAEYREKAALFMVLSRIESIRYREDIDFRSAPEEYQAAFRAYGIDAETATPEEIAAAANQGGGEAVAVMRRAIDDWVSRHVVDRDLGRKLIQAANLMDEDPWRQKLRLAILNDDRELLGSLADSLSHSPRPPESVILLAHAISGPPGIGDPAAGLKALIAADRRQPGDFWINLRIAVTSSLHGVGDPDDAVVHARIAVAMRPSSPQVRAALGLALLRRSRSDAAREGDRATARECLETALESAPDDPLALMGTAISLKADGDVEGAREIADRLIAQHPNPERARKVIERLLK